MSDQPLLQAVSVSKIYSGRHGAGVQFADLDVKPHQITAIIGESGSGKSTLLKLLYGLLSPQKGQILYKGEPILGPHDKLIPGHDSMKMVTQHTDDLNLHASVWDNVAHLLPNTDLQAKQQRTTELLKQLKLFHMADKRVVELSGGEKQRVAIAKALVTSPEVLFLDEPFNQVDTSFREGLQRDIRRIVDETGLTVVMVSHDPAEVLSMADELIVLRNGEIVEAGKPEELYTNPVNFYTATLLSNCNVVEGEEAKELGIKTNLSRVVIYPEWISIDKKMLSNKWKVMQILFKGPYEELWLTYNDLNIRVFNLQLGKFPIGKGVSIKVNKYKAF
ncbi:ABC transporter ATP-binding protein [Mucilaginibacter ginkgonis]|uniref:ABC transporter ATP-binding protein n=1 Tax=Mucilaginibacter ginkgonis TaxID=2682091 RepID=A0A6I4IPI8_9SPHI|nr:ABC transporter ATP-binding protein [Mucilaginibacter ginkgonis]QQL49112.1 ABC transporter ATP-binding protein [Mucilaginibacter ginkgonis]